MAAPTFTVVINTYNRATILPRAISSVIAQTFRDLEVVVVDDGSLDDTGSVVAGFSDWRVRYVRRDNGGLARARNTGLRSAAGDYVAFLDDDDTVQPTWLGAFMTAIERDNLTVVSCGVEFLNGRGRISTRLPAPLGAAFDDQCGLFLAGTFVARRDVLTAIGGFDEDLPWCEQTELMLRLLPHCVQHGYRVGAVPEPLVTIHRASDAERQSRHPEYLYRGTMRVLERHGGRLARSPDMLSNFNAIAGVNAARLGRFADARRLVLAAIVASPRHWKNYVRFVLMVFRPAARRVWRPRVPVRLSAP